MYVKATDWIYMEFFFTKDVSMDKKVLVKFWKLLASKSDCNRIVLPHCLMFTIATVTNASYISIFKKHLS